jgi:DNA polymerase-3 subunit delta'
MLFRDVVGQEEVIHRLKEMVDQNRLSHALIFIGREGSGTLPLALALSSYVIEQWTKRNPGSGSPDLFGNASPPPAEENNASVDKARQYLHPDIHYSFPVIKKSSGSDTPPVSNDWITEWREFLVQFPYGNLFDWLEFIGAENKQGKITAAECEDISRKLNLKSFEGGYKILIQWLPEMMGNEGNKLLKLIEEPPVNTLFLLVTENEELVLPTILSRCQSIRVPPIEPAPLQKALTDRCKLKEDQALIISKTCEGNYREALQLIQHSEEDWMDLLRTWLNLVVQAQLPGQVKWVEQAGTMGREKQKQLLRHFLHLIEAAVRIQATGEEAVALVKSEFDFAVRLNKICDLNQLEAIASELDKALYYIERNANGKLLFMALSIRLFHLIRHKSVVELDV